MSKNKVIVSLVILFFISLWIVNTLIIQNKEHKINITLNSHLKTLSTHYDMIMYDQKLKADAIYKRTIRNKDIINLLKEANHTKNKRKLVILRHKLKNIIKDDYKIYKEDGVLQYHFVFPNNITFFRMHKPSKYGDDLSKIRLDFSWANKNKKEIHGFQKGKTSHAFRNIQPIIDSNNKFLGTIDVGFTSGELQDRLNKVSKIHTHFIVKKNIFTTKAWDRDDINTQYITSSESSEYMIGIDKEYNFGHVTKSRKYIENKKDKIKKYLNEGKEFSILVENGKYRAISFYPIHSLITNDISAWIISYSKDENINLAFRESKNLIIISNILLFILFIFLYRLLTQREMLDVQVKKQTKSLALVNKELNEVNKIIKNKSKETIKLLEQYKYTVDTALIVSKSDLKGIITFANDNFCKLSGYTKQELIGQPHSLLREENVSKEVFKELWDTIQSNKIWRGSFANKGKYKRYHVKATIAPITDINGNIIEYMSIREDITEQIELEHKSNQLLKRSQEIMNSQDSLIIISSATDIIEANKKLFDITGISSLEKFLKRHKCVCELFVPREGYLVESTKDRLWAEPIFENPNGIHKAIIKDIYTNEDIIFEVKANKIVLDGDNFTIFTFSDITAVEKIREEAVASQKAKSDFLANMSHEIRTPMNGISGFLQLLEKTDLDKKQAKYLEITQSSMKTLLQIINDILDFSKIESGNMTSEMLYINPFTDLYKSYISFSAKANEKKITYNINIDQNLHNCYLMDQLHIHQVMQNLINNAIKFTPENGEININVKKIENLNTHDKIKFSVVDTGIGIAKENQDKILQAFSQADNSTTRKFGGTGLGLSISKSLTTLMGGELKINSQENKGSEFYFELKLEKTANCDKTDEQLPGNIILFFDNKSKYSDNIITKLNSFDVEYTTISNIDNLELKINYYNIFITDNIQYANDIKNNYNNEIKIILLSEKYINNDLANYETINIDNLNSSKLFNILLSYGVINSNIKIQNNIKSLNILIADDYEINRILLGDILDEYENITYNFKVNGQEVVDEMLCVDKNKYDFIFMDINMPILDGIEATKIIRDNNIDIPIIALTANALEGDKEKFLSNGMNDYLAKPIDLDELDKIIRYYMIQKNDGLLDNMIKKEKELNPLDIEDISNDDIKNAIELTMKKMKFPQKIVMKLFNSYINGASSLLKKYNEGLKNNDFNLISKAAHDLKSSSLTLNFNKIGNLAQIIESKSSNSEEFEYDESYKIFKKHFEKLQEYITNN